MSEQVPEPASPSTVAPSAVTGPSTETATPDGRHEVGGPGSSQLTQKLDDLARHFREVTDRLGPVLSAMAETGTPPPYQSVEALADCHRRFLRLRHDYLGALPEERRTADAAEQIRSLDDLRRVSKSVPTAVPSRIPELPSVADSLSAHEPRRLEEAEPPSHVTEPGTGQDDTQSSEALPHSELVAEPIQTSVVDPIGEARLEPAAPVEGLLSPPPMLTWESGLDASPWPPLQRDREDEISETTAPAVASCSDEDSGADSPPAGESVLVVPEESSPQANESLVVAQPDLPPEEPEGPAEAQESEEPGGDTGAANNAAIAVLARAARVRLRDGSEPAELLQFLNEVRVVRQALETHDTKELEGLAAEILEGSHPIARLLQAIESPEQLSDIAWADLHARISTSFGRPLALAMARRKLVLKDESD